MEYQLYNSTEEIKFHGKSQDQVHKELYDLWRECFGDTKAYTDFYFTWKVKDNRIISIYKGEKISSMLHLNPYTIKVGNKEEHLNYIVGVATRPKDRRKGLMRQLLETSLKQMYEEKMPFTYLMPAAEKIYHPFGFRIVYNQPPWKKMLLQAGDKNKGNLSDKFRAGQIKVIRIRETDEEEILALISFTESHLEKYYDIYTKRSPYYYKRLIHEMDSGKGAVLLVKMDNIPIGYMAYMTDSGFGIAECIYNEEVKEYFFSVVANEIGNDIVTAEDTGSDSTPSIMARIVDFEAFIKNITSREKVMLTVKVEDVIIPANNGVYQLTFSTEGCKIFRTNQEAEVIGNISELTSLFFGRLTDKELSRLTGENPEVQSKISKINFYTKVFINDVV